MDHPDLYVALIMENSIGLKRVEDANKDLQLEGAQMRNLNTYNTI